MRSYSQQSSNNNTDDKQQHPRSPVKLERKPALRLQNSLEYEGIHLDQNPDVTDDDLFDAATIVLPGEFNCKMHICPVLLKDFPHVHTTSKNLKYQWSSSLSDYPVKFRFTPMTLELDLKVMTSSARSQTCSIQTTKIHTLLLL